MWRQTLGVILFLYFTEAAFEGDPCNNGGVPGTCTNLKFCQADDIQPTIDAQICSSNGTDPIVCCVRSSATTSATPIVTISTQQSPKTTKYEPPEYEYIEMDDRGYKTEGCDPIIDSLTSNKTGQKAWDKCIEYQEQLIYPCVKAVTFTSELTRAKRCEHSADELIVGGEDASKNEFPHMALLGYVDKADMLEWLCGGSIISEWFILTAGHCTSTNGRIVLYARVGALKRSDPIDYSRVYNITQIHKHPEYNPPSKYNDIALLKTDRSIALDSTVVPACLHVGDRVMDDQASVTGWGLLFDKGGLQGDNLQKATLTKFGEIECALQYTEKTKGVEHGFNPRTQMCYGDRRGVKDTCQGDSGGPLQIKSKSVNCMYLVVGVTSFGKSCGYQGEAGIYTKVAAYVPWIESIVWP